MNDTPWEYPRPSAGGTAVHSMYPVVSVLVDWATVFSEESPTLVERAFWKYQLLKLLDIAELLPCPQGATS